LFYKRELGVDSFEGLALFKLRAARLRVGLLEVFNCLEKSSFRFILSRVGFFIGGLVSDKISSLDPKLPKPGKTSFFIFYFSLDFYFNY
jgi:hypothetical protein